MPNDNQPAQIKRTQPQPVQSLQEFVDSRGQTLRLDRTASVLQGVKLLGLTSRNGRTYRETALRGAIALYEGARVNVNHPSGDPLGPRDYRDRLGVVRNVELRPGQGLFGALHFNPKHPLAEQLVWDAEHAPENVGLSHNVLANTHREGEQLFVESIVHVQSVDLVADPATTGGLFEQVQTPNEQTTTEAIDWDALTLETLQARRPDLLASLTEIQHERAVDLMRRIDRLEQQLEAARPRTQSKEQSLLGEATAVRTATTQEFVSAIAGRR